MSKRTTYTIGESVSGTCIHEPSPLPAEGDTIKINGVPFVVESVTEHRVSDEEGSKYEITLRKVNQEVTR